MRKLTLTALSILMATSTVMDSQRQTPAPASIVPSRVVDLNVATNQELMTLEGVNAEIAEKIIRGRPYRSVGELRLRNIIDYATYEKIKTKVRIVPTKTTPKQTPVKAPFGTGPGEK